VDGRLLGEVDLYSPSTLWQSESVFRGFGEGEHVFEIRVLNRKDPRSSGTYVDLDELIVR
jgi:hypothetical protein